MKLKDKTTLRRYLNLVRANPVVERDWRIIYFEDGSWETTIDQDILPVSHPCLGGATLETITKYILFHMEQRAEKPTQAAFNKAITWYFRNVEKCIEIFRDNTKEEKE